MQSKRSAVPCVLFLLAALCRPAGGIAQTASAPDAAAERSRLIRELDSVAQAVTVHSDSAPLWLRLGQVRLALARRHAIAREGPLQPVGSNYARGAAAAFMRVLELDGNSVDAALALPAALAEQPEWPAYADAANALRRTAATAAGRDPRVLLVRARIERAAGFRDSALVLPERALAAGGDSGAAYLELARELYFTGDSAAGARAYWAGAARAGSAATRARYRDLIEPISSDAELASFDSLVADSISPWLNRFWARRDASEALPSGHRLQEQFRRLEYVLTRFRKVRRQDPDHPRNDLLTDSLPFGVSPASQLEDLPQLFADREMWLEPRAGALGWFDPRARMYLRHGAPDARAGQWWLYHRPGGDLLVNTGYSAPGSLCSLVQKYCALELGGLRAVGMRRFRKWQKERATMMQIALETDDAAPRFENPLAPAVEIYGLGAPGDAAGPNGRVLAVVAVPGGKLTALHSDLSTGGAIYRLRLHLVAGVADGSGRFDLDTVRTFTTPEPLTKSEFLTATTLLAVPSGMYDVRLVIEQRGDSMDRTEADTSGFAPAIAAQRGALVGLDSVEVPDPASSRLGLSDIILGRPGSGLTWTPPGGAPVPLNPLNAFPPGGTVALYYQVSGLAPGARYRTDVSLAPADDPKGRAVVTLSFTDRAASRWTEVRRTLDLAQLKPGHYRLTVKVAGANGAAATRSGLVNIVGE